MNFRKAFSSTRMWAVAVPSLFIAASCGGSSAYAPAPIAPVVGPVPEGEETSSGPSASDAERFVDDVNAEIKQVSQKLDRAAWVKSTYITPDTEYLEAKEYEQLMELLSRKVKEARKFEGLDLPPETARALYLLKFSAGLPAPSDPDKRARLAELSSKLEGIYGKGKYCSPKLKGKGPDKKSECLELDDLDKIMNKSRDWDTLLDVWRGWRTISPPMRPMYQEFVSLGNEGAKELGFSDMAAIWKGGYDMTCL